MAEPSLSIQALFAEREARHQRDQAAAEQLQHRKDEELAAFRHRLEHLQLTDEIVQHRLDQIKRAFERGETELMISAFPSEFCTDGGRAVINAGAPPINKPSQTPQDAEPDWLATMPAGVRQVHDFWKTHLKPGGFGFAARVINYPEGKPGDIGLFFTWPRSALEAS